MNHRMIKELAEGLKPAISEAFKTAVKPLLERLAAVEARTPEKGDKGERGDLGPAGSNGNDADPEKVAELIASEVKSVVEALPISNLVLVEVNKVFETIPRPADGTSITVDDVRPLLQEMVKALPKPTNGEPGSDGVGLAGAIIDHDGQLVVTLTNGDVRQLGRVVGERGIAGEDGAGFDNIEKVEDELTFGMRFGSGDSVKELIYSKATLADFDQEVWKPGHYKRGAVVSFGGSGFLARRDTDARPETNNDWRMFVKRGRDGKDGVMRPAPELRPVALK